LLPFIIAGLNELDAGAVDKQVNMDASLNCGRFSGSPLAVGRLLLDTKESPALSDNGFPTPKSLLNGRPTLRAESQIGAEES
jgi:hypothetical protein